MFPSVAFASFAAVQGSFASGFRPQSTLTKVDHRNVAQACRSRTSRRAKIIAAAPRIVNSKELESILKSQPGPILCDMYAPWCGPCQFLIPELEKLAARMGDRIQILKLDTDKDPDYATAIGVRGLPTLFFIQDGRLKHKMEGAMTAEDLAQLVEYYFFDGPEPSVPGLDIPKV